MKRIKFIFLLFVGLLQCRISFSQVENVPSTHPIYPFLKRMWIQQNLNRVCFFKIPFTRNEIISLLDELKKNSNRLSQNDLVLLLNFEQEFRNGSNQRAVVINSQTDTIPLLFRNFFTQKEKFIYYFNDSVNSVNIKPLGAITILNELKSKDSKSAIYGELGLRIFGTISNTLGYYMQVTNGRFLRGNRDFALTEDNRLSHSVKFALLNSDFDLVESHIRFEKNWFFTGFARERRLLGSGINQTIVVSDNAPPMDEIFAGVKFKNFRYEFSHFSLIGKSRNSFQTSVNSDIPPKFWVMHRASFIFPKWNLTYFETVMYSERNIEFGYLNPFTFLKSVEHSLHDRDKSSMGISFELNPFPKTQIAGSWMLEDLIFSEIGKGFWGNKTAWNLGIVYSFNFPLDVSIEYTRIEPYMFTHFNNQNNRTNDGKLIGTPLQPNSDEISVNFCSFLNGCYPLLLKISYIRHGANLIDDSGNVVRNVGGDFNVNHSSTDSWVVSFLDGIRDDKLIIELSYGIEIIRDLNLRLLYQYRKSINESARHILKIQLKFEDF